MSVALALLPSEGMRRLPIAFVVLALLLAACTGYRFDATHRPPPSAGAPGVSTGPTADPGAHTSALPRAVVALGTRSRGDVPALGVLTGVMLLAALGLGLYTLALVYRHPPRER
jgi:hypothetical protein